MLPCPEPSRDAARGQRLGGIAFWEAPSLSAEALPDTPLLALGAREAQGLAPCFVLAASLLLGSGGHRLVPWCTGSFEGQREQEAFRVWGSAGAALPGSAQ